jgi:hypothetical protein
MERQLSHRPNPYELYNQNYAMTSKNNQAQQFWIADFGIFGFANPQPSI